MADYPDKYDYLKAQVCVLISQTIYLIIHSILKLNILYKVTN